MGCTRLPGDTELKLSETLHMPKTTFFTPLVKKTIVSVQLDETAEKTTSGSNIHTNEVNEDV